MRLAILATAAIGCLAATGTAAQDALQRCVVIAFRERGLIKPSSR